MKDEQLQLLVNFVKIIKTTKVQPKNKATTYHSSSRNIPMQI